MGQRRGWAIPWLKSRLLVVTLLLWVCLGRESRDEQVKGRPGPGHDAASSLCLALTGDSLTHHRGGWPIAPCSDQMPKSEWMDSGLSSGAPTKTPSGFSFPPQVRGRPVPLEVRCVSWGIMVARAPLATSPFKSCSQRALLYHLEQCLLQNQAW